MKSKVLGLIKKYKWPLFLVINILPFVIDLTLFSFGSPIDVVLFPPVFFTLTFLNYYFFDKTLHYVIIQFYIFVCMFCSGCFSTYLYYHNVSNDPMTPAVGVFMVILGTVIIAITTTITSIIKSRTPKESAQ